MGARYLTDLVDVCAAAGLVVVEVSGWQSRARGSGGYEPGRPDHVMVHHTASPSSSDGWPDANYIATGHPDSPISNLYLDRSGTVYVIAAGASNTNGKGSDWWGGGVPDDSMNSHAIGIEAGNTGTGEVWPSDQCAAYQVLSGALCDAYGIAVGCVRAHWEWAPTRKIDPAGPSPWATGSDSWNMDGFRAALTAATPPLIGDDDVTDDDIERIANLAAQKVWTFKLGNITTGELDEAGDIMRSGANQAYRANPANQ